MYSSLPSQTPQHLSELSGLNLPVKPREVGLTSVLDKGLGLHAMQDLVELAGPYIDVVKLGWGTAALYPASILASKIALLRSADIAVCPGGTLLEIAWAQARIEAFFAFAKAAGFTAVEVSDGTYAIPQRDKLALIARAARLGFRVVSEVGKKSPEEDAKLTPEQRVDLIRQELDAGAWKVILEGRESGTVGIYNTQGTVQSDLVDLLVAEFGVTSLIFEAPQKSQQVWLMRHYGSLVNLGNVPPEEVVSVATLRYGLRSDTVRPVFPDVLHASAALEWAEIGQLMSMP
jgi:phosphosulfolactate synthase (CoM biosynthesis protein A)